MYEYKYDAPSIVSYYVHTFAGPSVPLQAFCNVRNTLRASTTTPNAAHAYAASFCGARVGVSLLSLIKHRAGNIYARAVADTPPVISSITPRSHVARDTGGGDEVNHHSTSWKGKRQRTDHGGEEDYRGQDNMPSLVEIFMLKEELFDDLVSAMVRVTSDRV